MFEYKTKRGRIAGVLVLLCIVCAGIIVFIASSSPVLITISIFISVFGVAFLPLFFVPSREERETKEKQERDKEVLANAKVVAEAIAEVYPYPFLSGPTTYSLAVLHILHDHLFEFVKCRENHENCDRDFCCNNKATVQKAFEKTLAILAKRFELAGEEQKKHQVKIDEIVRRGEKISHEAVEEIFSLQELLDTTVNKAKDAFWKVHGAGKKIGLRAYPKREWYLLMWREDICQ